MRVFDQIKAEQEQRSFRGITVTITEADGGALDGIAEVRVTNNSSMADTYEAEASKQDDADYTVLKVLNITLIDEDGSETEPAGSVNVTFSGSAVEEAQEQYGADAESNIITVYSEEDFFRAVAGTTTSLTILHVEEENNNRTYSNVDANTTEDAIAFNTDSFSDYILLYSRGDLTKNNNISGNYSFDGNGKTYRLMDDIELENYINVSDGVSTTIDLNNHTLESVDGMDIAGKLTIRDDSDEGEGIISVEGKIEINGTLDLSGGNIEGVESENDYFIKIDSDGTLNLSGGDIKGEKEYPYIY